MLTEAMNRYLEKPPANWDELSNKEKQYFRNLEARMRAHVSDAVQDLHLLCTKLTPAQLDRVYSHEQTDALIQVVEAGLIALRAPMEMTNSHLDFMIDFTTQSSELRTTLKRAVSDPEHFKNLENELEECHHMRDSMEYELKRITLEEYKDRLEKARSAQLNKKKV